MSDRPSTPRAGYSLTTYFAIETKPICSRCSTSIGACSGSGSGPAVFSTSASIERTTSSASSARPCVSSQRGLSGMKRRMARMQSASVAPIANPSR
jgi:hypothetical protein